MSGFPYILLGIAILLVVLLVFLLQFKARGAPASQPPRNMKVQVLVSTTLTVFLVTLWWFYKFPIALIPALVLPQWIAVYSSRSQPSPRKRWILATLVGLTVLLVLITALFWLTNSQA